MPSELTSQPEFIAAFRASERQDRIHTGKVASALVVFLMPAGVLLDYFMFKDDIRFKDDILFFLCLRLVCSALAAVLWYLHTTSFGKRHYQFLGLPIALLPAFFIAWMIHATTGPVSPYYAGLNLVLLAVSVVVHWSTRESLIAVIGVLLMYSAACVLRGTKEQIPLIFNNFYFLILTGIIVVTGNHFFNQLRFREFTLRYELDRNKKALESSLHQLKENELQLVQSEKLASLGRMSAGIIHEINNPLNFATTGLFTLRKKGKLLPAEQQADYAEIMKDVEDGIKRVQTIVSDLRTFTHPNTEQLDPVKVGDVVTPALRFLSNEWRDRVHIEQNFTADQTIWANKNKLIQVIVNMLQNSLDVLGEKKFPDDERPTISIIGHVENGRTMLSIRDNGTGIDDKHLDKIFDPFFTTKDVGKGMGLGLSICYKIVQEYGGDISVKTEPGKFCEFTLEFPVKG